MRFHFLSEESLYFAFTIAAFVGFCMFYTRVNSDDRNYQFSQPLLTGFC